jgi:hypothetical protein
MNKKLIKQNGFYKLIEGDFILAKVDFNGHSSKHYPIGKLSKQNCDEIFGVVDVDKWVKEKVDNRFNETDGYHKVVYVEGLVEGFNKAMELNKDKMFTKDDVISMIEKSRETGLTAEYIILSNQQTEWDVEIVAESMNIDEIREQGKGFLNANLNKPKLDDKGRLILKII